MGYYECSKWIPNEMLDSLYDEANETIPPRNSMTAVSDACMSEEESTYIPEEAKKIFEALEGGRKIHVVFQWLPQNQES